MSMSSSPSGKTWFSLFFADFSTVLCTCCSCGNADDPGEEPPTDLPDGGSSIALSRQAIAGIRFCELLCVIWQNGRRRQWAWAANWPIQSISIGNVYKLDEDEGEEEVNELARDSFSILQRECESSYWTSYLAQVLQTLLDLEVRSTASQLAFTQSLPLETLR